MDLHDILHESGQDNSGGLQQEFYFAKLSDIATFPTPIDAPTTPTEKMTISSDFVMKSGKNFHKGYMTWGRGGVSWTLQGPMDGKSFRHNFEFYKPGADEESLSFLSLAKNENLVFIMKDKDGKFRVVGSEGIPAKMDSSEGGTGQTGEDDKGDTITFVSEGANPPYFYSGTIPVAAASGSA